MELLPSTGSLLAAENTGYVEDGDGDGIDLTLRLSIGSEKRKNPLPRGDCSGDRMRVQERHMKDDRADLEVLMLRSRAREGRIPILNLFGGKIPIPMVYPYHQVQYVPAPNGFAFGFPFVMPWWASTISPPEVLARGASLSERKTLRQATTNPCNGGSEMPRLGKLRQD